MLVDDNPVPADLYGLADMAVVGRHGLNAAVAVPVITPIHKQGHPMAGVLRTGKGPTRVVRSLFHCPEHGFGVGVIVGDHWPGEGSEKSLLLQPPLQRDGTHGVAVIGVKQQGLLAALGDPIADVGPTHQIRCDGWILSFGDGPGDSFAAAHVDHEIERQPHSTKGCLQVRDALAPHLVRLYSP